MSEQHSEHDASLAAGSAPGRLFDIGGGPWEITDRRDPVVCALADRHYPRRSVGCGQLGGPGRVLVLRAKDWRAGWISYYTQHPDDGLYAWRCSMFRNEGDQRSSWLIREAMSVTAGHWGAPPADGWLTYVDAAKVESNVPGWCFRRAGWRRDRTYRPDRRRASLIRLRALAAGSAGPRPVAHSDLEAGRG